MMVENKRACCHPKTGQSAIARPVLLSKELLHDQLKQTTAADARELHSIRNALEHTYLSVSG